MNSVKTIAGVVMAMLIMAAMLVGPALLVAWAREAYLFLINWMSPTIRSIFFMGIAAGFGLVAIGLFGDGGEFPDKRFRRFQEIIGAIACALIALHCLATVAQMSDPTYYPF